MKGFRVTYSATSVNNLLPFVTILLSSFIFNQSKLHNNVIGLLNMSGRNSEREVHFLYAEEKFVLFWSEHINCWSPLSWILAKE